MTLQPNFAPIAMLIGEPVRATMLAALLSGKVLTASELAHSAAITPQTASTHLARLVEGNLLRVTQTGRHRYYQLAGPQVAHVLETLATLAPSAPLAPRQAVRRPQGEIRFARTCYHHLAGVVGVALTERLLEVGLIAQDEQAYRVTQAGLAWLEQHGIDATPIMRSRRAPARACLDWTERRYHVAGAFGDALTHWFLAQGWIERISNSRALQVTARAGQIPGGMEFNF